MNFILNNSSYGLIVTNLGEKMKFVKWVYRIAGIYGLLVLFPQYFLETQNGIDYPPPINHPEYYYGFIGVALAWQFVLLLISTDPIKYRLLMPISVLEKFSYSFAVIILYFQDKIFIPVLAVGIIDLLLGILFIISFIKLKNIK